MNVGLRSKTRNRRNTKKNKGNTQQDQKWPNPRNSAQIGQKWLSNRGKSQRDIWFHFHAATRGGGLNDDFVRKKCWIQSRLRTLVNQTDSKFVKACQHLRIMTFCKFGWRFCALKFSSEVRHFTRIARETCNLCNKELFQSGFSWVMVLCQMVDVHSSCKKAFSAYPILLLRSFAWTLSYRRHQNDPSARLKKLKEIEHRAMLGSFSRSPLQKATWHLNPRRSHLSMPARISDPCSGPQNYILLPPKSERELWPAGLQ